MTAKHMGLVFDADGLDGAEKLLLLAYCNRTDDHGYCWPGQARLVDDCGTSPATVKRVKKSLIAKGLIASVRRYDRSSGEPITNLTRVNIPLLESMARPKRDYDDNVIETLTFDSPAPQPRAARKPKNSRKTAPDLLMDQDEPDPHGDEPDPGLNMSPTPAQDEPLILSEPSEEPSSSSPPPSDPRAAQATEDEDETARQLINRFPWPAHKQPGKARAKELVGLVVNALRDGWSPPTLGQHLRANFDPNRVRHPSSVVRALLSDLPPAPSVVIPMQRRQVPQVPAFEAGPDRDAWYKGRAAQARAAFRTGRMDGGE